MNTGTASAEKCENRHKKREPFALSSPLHPCLPLTSRRPVVIKGNVESSEFSRKIVEIVGK
jgi:hypothetical protein